MTNDEKFRLSLMAHGIATAITSGQFDGCSHDTRFMLRQHSIQLLELATDEREVATKAAVVRDIAIERAPNVQQLSARFGGMAFLVHAVGDAL